MSIFETGKKLHILGAFRCAEEQYNDAFLKHGSIKFGLPQKWVKDGRAYGQGRGDIYEGTFAACNVFDIAQMKELYSTYNLSNRNITHEVLGNRCYFKRKSSLLLPVFCLYGLKLDLFNNVISRTGWQTICGSIPAKYFSAFSNINDAINLPFEKQPSVVVIRDIDELKRRIYAKLRSMGIAEEEIITSAIQYYDYNSNGPNGWFAMPLEWLSEYPTELTVKDKSFEYQSEIRFIVNSQNAEAMERLRFHTVNIGSIEDIAQKISGYPKCGIDIQMDVEIGSEYYEH